MEKKVLVFAINWSRAAMDDPINIMSSAKNKDDTLTKWKRVKTSKFNFDFDDETIVIETVAKSKINLITKTLLSMQ